AHAGRRRAGRRLSRQADRRRRGRLPGGPRRPDRPALPPGLPPGRAGQRGGPASALVDAQRHPAIVARAEHQQGDDAIAVRLGLCLSMSSGLATDFWSTSTIRSPAVRPFSEAALSPLTSVTTTPAESSASSYCFFSAGVISLSVIPSSSTLPVLGFCAGLGVS